MDTLHRFAFSQSSLQDFVDCRRLFQLRYIQRVAWPALRCEPARENELRMRRGQRFHRLAQQYWNGVPAGRLTSIARADQDEHLLAWWNNFLDTWGGCSPLSGRFVETGLWAPVGGHRLVAQYDLIQVDDSGKVTIYDWKTSVCARPKREWLTRHMQTRIYPYLLVQASAALNHGCPFEPEQIQMIYWFAEPGQPPEVLDYNRARFNEDGEVLREIIRDASLVVRTGALARAGVLWSDPSPMCSSEAACRYCVYRSLCDRGVRAGDLSADGYDIAEDSSIDFTLEQIGEISF